MLQRSGDVQRLIAVELRTCGREDTLPVNFHHKLRVEGTIFPKVYKETITHPTRRTMKYLIVIPDGCADEPVEALDNRTPLQAAALPNIDKIVQRGIIGTSNNVPSTLLPASDVATLSLVGYDPLKVYTGRAPLETVAMHIPLGSNDWAIRCNLIHAPDGKMRDFTAGHISSEDGNALIRALQEQLGGREVAGGTIEFHPGVSYRNILVWRGHGDEAPFENTTTQAPHDVPDKPIAEHLPKGKGREVLIELMEASKPIFADHPANRNRDKPATQIWLWGQGKAPTVESFEKVYGKRGAIISAVDLVRGVGNARRLEADRRGRRDGLP